MADDDLVLYERHGAVAMLTLNRPERLNALTIPMEFEYFDLLDQCAEDLDVRAIVVTGAGKGWCAGADMDVLQSIPGDIGKERAATAEPLRPRIKQSHTVTIPKPVIAAINGACAGLGLVQALFCDLRFAAAGAKFTTAFSKRGLVAEHGISWTLPRLVGPANALDLLYSSRIVLAEEALTLGLVNRVYPPNELLDATIAYAADLAANCSPTALAATKRQIWTEQLLAAAEDEAKALMKLSFAHPDFKEGVASFLDKRPPSFTPELADWAIG